MEGRKPFSESEEASLLTELRKKQVWPCFKGDPECKIGKRGFRAFGYHEKQRLKERGPNAIKSLRHYGSYGLEGMGPDRSPVKLKHQSSYNIFIRFATPTPNVRF